MIHAITGDYKSHKEFLPDDVYGKVLDNIVKGVCDILCLRIAEHNEDDLEETLDFRMDKTFKNYEVLMGRRCVQPMPDWWILGGRMFPGETAKASVGERFELCY